MDLFRDRLPRNADQTASPLAAYWERQFDNFDDKIDDFQRRIYFPPPR